MSDALLMCLAWIAPGLFGFLIGWFGGIAEGRSRQWAESDALHRKTLAAVLDSRLKEPRPSHGGGA